MAKINVSMIQTAIQKMVNQGVVTCLGNNIVYHAKDGAYIVGTESDLVSVWNRISAYKSRDNN